MVNSANNIFIERNTDYGASSQTYMTMRTARLQSFQTAAEIESTSQGFQYVSTRMLARTRGNSGAVTAMFTYRPPPNPGQPNLVQEADLEIRTVDPATHISLTNQPSWNDVGDIPQATRNVSLPGGRRWTDWAYYRMDWTPGSSTWYVNGQLVASITFQAPRDPAQLMFNSWSDGGSWSGNMSLNQAASLQIQWIDMVFNNTESKFVKSGNCVTTCTVDDNAQPGSPVPISGGGGQSGGGSGASGCQSPKYGQCAGKTWNGCTSCVAGTTCRYQNDYYSQCL
ncbi:Concanavalin A-like lectin/glucanase [Pleurostoma richardsiae]|uniref:Concanavalin A-like lectin/glucanase n=1 Tax=Pleurostoma richardsiae TaxID=41990 RepID=A0AA38SFD9_9PEZI|nr:Concanavalin A-like lectin/glucanase [Pleurostoma richardsiae]